MRDKIIKNGWSQGCILECKSIDACYFLCKEGKFNDKTLLLVISQSCDVVNDIEKNIECLVFRRIKEDKFKQDLTTGQNPRKLHVEYLDDFYEINAYEFVFIKKKYLVDYQCSLRIENEKLNVIRSFKSNRYIRTGLPENAAKLFEHHVFKSPLLTETLKAHGNTLHSIRLHIVETPKDRFSVAVIFLVKSRYYDEYVDFWEEKMENLILCPLRSIAEIDVIDVHNEYGLNDVMNASEFGIELAPKFPRFFYDALSMDPESMNDVLDD